MIDLTRRQFLKGLMATTATVAVVIALPKPELIKIRLFPGFKVPDGFEEIFEVMGMEDSYYTVYNTVQKHRAKRYTWDGRRHVPIHEYRAGNDKLATKIVEEASNDWEVGA